MRAVGLLSPMAAALFCALCVLTSCEERAAPLPPKPCPQTPTPEETTAEAPAPTMAPLRENIMARRERLLRIMAQRDASRIDEVLAILADENDVLSPLAAQAAGRLAGARAEAALVAACRDRRAEVRSAALAALVEIASPSALGICRRLFQEDRSPETRAAAAMGLGRLGDRASASALRETLVREREALVLRLASAWALAALDQEEGWRFLEQSAAAAAPHLCCNALMLLADLPHERSALTFLRALSSPEKETRAIALAGLASLPRHYIDAALTRQPANLATKLRGRWEMLACLEGSAPCPASCPALLAERDAALRRLALLCLLQKGNASSLPLIINCLEDDDVEVQTTAQKALPEFAQRCGFAVPPETSGAPARTWQRWWLGLCRIAACAGESATIVLPDGRQRQVKRGFPFEFHSVVTAIYPAGPNRKTAAVEIDLAGQRLLIR